MYELLHHPDLMLFHFSLLTLVILSMVATKNLLNVRPMVRCLWWKQVNAFLAHAKAKHLKK